MQNAVDPELAQEFVSFAVQAGVLRFGEFRTKAGRLSPYFFNAGLFDDGAKLGRLAEFYARRLLAEGEQRIQFDMIFGPAYKGITLAAALAVELARRGRNLPYAYNRKEAKDHRESIAMIRAAGGQPSGVVIALDRQEQATEDGRDVAWSAVQYVSRELKLEVAAIATLDDLLQYLRRTADPALGAHVGAVQAYRDRYGV